MPGWGEYGGFNGYFVIQFSAPFHIYGTWKNKQIMYENTEILGQQDTVGAFVGFEFLDKLTLKVGTSFTGFDGALANLNAEIPGWSIDDVKEKTKSSWDSVLSKVE
ncbi:MAG: hypothetical protein U5K79_23665 [Cyclobacteriaceae bacterium]|nr:hypothetical protein [Cyclobacteriaceae bacterium]